MGETSKTRKPHSVSEMLLFLRGDYNILWLIKNLE